MKGFEVYFTNGSTIHINADKWELHDPIFLFLKDNKPIYVVPIVNVLYIK